MYLLKEEPPEGEDSYTEGRVHKCIRWYTGWRADPQWRLEASGCGALVDEGLIEETESHGELEKVGESGAMCCQSLVWRRTLSSGQTSVRPPQAGCLRRSPDGC